MRVTNILRLAAFLGLASCLPALDYEIVSVKKIWDQGDHNAFTDIIRFKNRWYCTFREADDHVGGDGRIRVLVSQDGEKWESSAVLTEAGIDLRDPKFSITPNNRLMIVMGGSVYQGTKVLKGRRPRVAFSKDGKSFTTPRMVLEEGDWLWRVTWHKGVGYGISYRVDGGPDWAVSLQRSTDGVRWTKVKDLDVPGRPNEATLRFLPNGDMVALVRRESGDKQGWIGVSRAPFLDWKWKPAGSQLGGPNFIVLPDGQMVAGSRDYREAGARKYTTVIGPMTTDGFTQKLSFPSGGDTSYPGFVFHEGVLWMSYYSSHEGKTSIYLAKIR